MNPLIQDVIEFYYSRHGPVAVPTHVHHFCQLDVIVGGSMDILTPHGRTTLKRGVGTLIPPLLPHAFESAGKVRHATFKIRVHPEHMPMIGHALRIVRFNRHQLSWADAANTWSQSNGLADAHAVHASATIFLSHALNTTTAKQAEAERPSGSSPLLWEVLDAISANPYSKWTVAEMARRCHLSEGHFTKMFARTFGQTPQRFLLETRIWSAASHLNRDCVSGEGATSIKSLARTAGYANVHSFTRAFKRAMGVSPAAYARSQGHL